MHINNVGSDLPNKQVTCLTSIQARVEDAGQGTSCKKERVCKRETERERELCLQIDRHAHQWCKQCWVRDFLQESLRKCVCV